MKPYRIIIEIYDPQFTEISSNFKMYAYRYHNEYRCFDVDDEDLVFLKLKYKYEIVPHDVYEPHESYSNMKNFVCLGG